MLEACFGIPQSVCGILDSEQLDVLPPGQFANDPLENCQVRLGLSKATHVAQIGRGEAPCIGELGTQIGGKPIDYLAAPAILDLPLDDVATDAPVEADQLAVDGECSPHACLAYGKRWSEALLPG